MADSFSELKTELEPYHFGAFNTLVVLRYMNFNFLEMCGEWYEVLDFCVVLRSNRGLLQDRFMEIDGVIGS